MNCIFCKIIKGEIPSSKIYEDNNFIAILDLSQATYGHTLIIPKNHYANLLDIDKDVLAESMITVQKVSNILMEKLNCEGFNIINNCNEIAGQTVMHFHIHIIPRYKDDNFKLETPNNQGKYNFEEIISKINKK